MWAEYDIEESKKINSEKPKFDLPSGLTFYSSKFEDPIEVFNLFFDDKFIDDICEYTNMYHRENRTARDRRGSHQKKWKKPDIVEMRAFLGLLLFTGIVKKPNIKDYWSESILFGTPGIAQIFSRDQFLDIRKSLHFVDEKKCDKQDFLYKDRPLIEKIISFSQKFYISEQFLSIDECMIRFNGRSKMKVYMPLKPIKYGFKAYILSEAKTGYVMSWKLIEGGRKKNK